MNCKGVQPLLSAYLDRELDGSEMLDVRRHLADCSECSAEIENLRSLKHLLGGLGTAEPPLDLEDRLLANVLRERERSPRPRVAFSRTLVFAGVAICSMFVTLAILSNAPKSTPITHAVNPAIPFEIQRDQASSVGADPLGGAPLITAAAYGQH